MIQDSDLWAPCGASALAVRCLKPLGQSSRFVPTRLQRRQPLTTVLAMPHLQHNHHADVDQLPAVLAGEWIVLEVPVVCFVSTCEFFHRAEKEIRTPEGLRRRLTMTVPLSAWVSQQGGVGVLASFAWNSFRQKPGTTHERLTHQIGNEGLEPPNLRRVKAAL